MSIFHKRQLPVSLEAPWQAFVRALAAVEGAKSSLVDSVPQARFPGTPVQQALKGFCEGLTAAEELMGPWRCAETDAAWLRCSSGLQRALSGAVIAGEERNLLEEELVFEAHLAWVQDLLEPLLVFEEAEERFRALRI